MRNSILSLFALLLSSGLLAQNNNWFYATTDTQSAEMLQNNNTDKIQIINSLNGVSAVYMSPELISSLKENGNLHGPGYLFRKDENKALATLEIQNSFNEKILNFDITEDSFVQQCIAMVEEQNLENTILLMEGYGTRFHTTSSGVQASLDLRDRWQDLVDDAGRTDITVVNYDHDFTDQKSVILTIPGSESPDEYVIIGGHLDSGDFWLQDFAPGADDNGSGIATLTETLRILLANNFHPKKTVQIMGYAAEEIGLMGSADIAEEYSNEAKDVLAVLQFDMTNYSGSSFDIAIIEDSQYTSFELNDYLVDLLEHYNSAGEHIITYGFSACGYACSDHVSWTENGYMASFPFEAAMGEDNPNIHTTNDTYEAMGSTAEHSVKFVKLALEFVIETAKTSTLGLNEIYNPQFQTVVENHQLIYEIDGENLYLKSIQVFDLSGRQLISKEKTASKGALSLNGLSDGVYIAVFKDKSGKAYTKKFLLK